MPTPPATVDGVRALGGSPYIFALPELRLVYVSVAKNACTSLKWLVADLAEEDLSAFRAGLLPLTSDEEAIHVRRQWRRARRLGDLDDVQLDQIAAGDWFVFGVVRDPRNRIFSAWQDKLLLNDPRYHQYRETDWYPQARFEADAIVDDFHRFVDHLREHPDHALLTRDRHFLAQARSLHLDAVPYTGLYDVSELSTLMSDLREHVRRSGRTELPELRRSNDTPLRANGAVITPEIDAKIQAIYRSDFEQFGTRWDVAAIRSRADWTAAELRLAETMAAYSLRIGELGVAARDARGEAKDLRGQVASLEKSVRRLRTRVRRLTGTAATQQRDG